jgi:hypothetical protein
LSESSEEEVLFELELEELELELELELESELMSIVGAFFDSRMQCMPESF